MGIKINSVYPYEQDKSQQILSILELVVLSLIKNLMSGNYQHDKIKGSHYRSSILIFSLSQCILGFFHCRKEMIHQISFKSGIYRSFRQFHI